MTTPRRTQTPSNAHTPAPETASDALQLPPPSTFDFIPPLHALLARLLLPSPGIHAVGPESSGAADPTAAVSAPIAGDDAAAAAAAALAGSGHLGIQQLGPASSAIKTKIQKARNAVRLLPEVDRTVEEQEDEIAFLEGRIAKMRAVLADVGRIKDVEGDVDMGDG